MNLFTSFSRLLASFLIFAFLTTQVTAGNKNKNEKGTTNRGATEKTITGKVSEKRDRHKFTVNYQIGSLLVGRSVRDKVKEFDGKTVTAKCRIHKGIIVRIYEIEEATKPDKKKKKKK